MHIIFLNCKRYSLGGHDSLNVMERRLQIKTEHPERRVHQSQRKGSGYLRHELQREARWALLHRCRDQSCASDHWSVWKTLTTVCVVYKGNEFDSSPLVLCLCCVNESDTLLVCSREKGRTECLPIDWWHWLEAVAAGVWRSASKIPMTQHCSAVLWWASRECFLTVLAS